MRNAPAPIGQPSITNACSEIFRRYRAAGFSHLAAREQAAAFASRFDLPIVDRTQPAANCNGEPDFEATLASVAEAIG